MQRQRHSAPKLHLCSLPIHASRRQLCDHWFRRLGCSGRQVQRKRATLFGSQACFGCCCGRCWQRDVLGGKGRGHRLQQLRSHMKGHWQGRPWRVQKQRHSFLCSGSLGAVLFVPHGRRRWALKPENIQLCGRLHGLAINKLAIVPNALLGYIQSASAIEGVILPEPTVSIVVCKLAHALATPLSIFPCSFVPVTIGVGHGALTRNAVFMEFASVYIPILLVQNTFTMHFVAHHLAFVAVPVLESKGTLAMHLPHLKISNIAVAIVEAPGAPSLYFSVNKFAFIEAAILECESSLSVLDAVLVLPLICSITICILVHSSAIALVICVLSLVAFEQVNATLANSKARACVECSRSEDNRCIIHLSGL
mmetsp:Transcript_8737/g.23491  ORF Transcript_8737/g.23491 Transcript_8737/m.23491 type:complete len:366 (+) Transcript_8737:1265-2362(+)